MAYPYKIRKRWLSNMTEEKKIEIIRHAVLGRSLDDISVVLKVEKADIQQLLDRNPKTVERIRSEYIAKGIPVAKRIRKE